MIGGNPQPFLSKEGMILVISLVAIVPSPALYTVNVSASQSNTHRPSRWVPIHTLLSRGSAHTHTVQFIGTQLRGIFFINRKLPAIEFIQPALGGKPHASLFILGNPHHVITGQPVFYSQSF